MSFLEGSQYQMQMGQDRRDKVKTAASRVPAVLPGCPRCEALAALVRAYDAAILGGISNCPEGRALAAYAGVAARP